MIWATLSEFSCSILLGRHSVARSNFTQPTITMCAHSVLFWWFQCYTSWNQTTTEWRCQKQKVSTHWLHGWMNVCSIRFSCARDFPMKLHEWLHLHHSINWIPTHTHKKYQNWFNGRLFIKKKIYWMAASEALLINLIEIVRLSWWFTCDRSLLSVAFCLTAKYWYHH